MIPCIVVLVITSRKCHLERGVRHGSACQALSHLPKWFDELSQTAKRAVIFDLQFGSPVQAETQIMKNMYYDYSEKWTFEFWQCKRLVLNFSSKQSNVTPELSLNQSLIHVDSTKHVGIILHNKFYSIEKKNILACWTICSVCISVIKLDIHPSLLDPVTCSTLLLQLCFSKYLYGCELWNNLTSHEMIV